MTTTLLQGDCRDILKTLPEKSIQACITSPPYWGLRDYGVAGQLGLEPTPDAYIEAMVDVFRAVKRVLRDDGTLWLNIGDTYAGSWGAMSYAKGDIAARRFGGDGETIGRPVSSRLSGDLKSKDLVGIPWMLAFALRADGWYLRCDIVWHKPNPMPESVTDRPTKAHEYIFLLSKSERYYYDAEAIKEQAVNGDPTAPRGSRGAVNGPNSGRRSEQRDYDKAAERYGVGTSAARTPAGGGWERTTRNRRSVWTISTTPYKDAHFATFPEALVEPCILAGSTAQACEVCGAAWVRQVERASNWQERKAAGATAGNVGYSETYQNGVHGAGMSHDLGSAVVTTGWQQACACSSEGTARSIILDPFAGSGTTLRVAERLGRDSVGIELNADYIKLQEKRTDGVQKLMVDLL